MINNLQNNLNVMILKDYFIPVHNKALFDTIFGDFRYCDSKSEFYLLKPLCGLLVADQTSQCHPVAKNNKLFELFNSKSEMIKDYYKSINLNEIIDYNSKIVYFIKVWVNLNPKFESLFLIEISQAFNTLSPIACWRYCSAESNRFNLLAKYFKIYDIEERNMFIKELELNPFNISSISVDMLYDKMNLFVNQKDCNNSLILFDLLLNNGFEFFTNDYDELLLVGG